MKAIQQALRPTRLALLAAAVGVLPLAANAQAPSTADMQARYKEDLQRCSTLTDPESQRTCRREAGAALQEARHNRLVNHDRNPSANASARCERLPGAQRADCERLMSDSGAVTHGSVSGGGVLREMTITVPADSTSSGTYSGQPATGSYGTQPAPATGSYGTQPVAPSGGYGAQPAPSDGYGSQPAPASGGYGSQPAPASGGYGTQPMTR